MTREGKRIARYELIALDIADQISNGKYELGARIHGRSTLASLYKVSPETIRNQKALIAEMEDLMQAVVELTRRG